MLSSEFTTYCPDNSNFAAIKMIMGKLIKRVFPVLLLTVCMVRCMKEEKGLTPEQVQHIADSIYKIKAQKLRQQAAEDLDRRMSIELKPKIDSLLGRTAAAVAPPSMNTDTAYDVTVPDSTSIQDPDTGIKKRH